jgi:hypothetical protein
MEQQQQQQQQQEGHGSHLQQCPADVHSQAIPCLSWQQQQYCSSSSMAARSSEQVGSQAQHMRLRRQCSVRLLKQLVLHCPGFWQG